MSAFVRRAAAADRLWRGGDKAVLAVLNAGAVGILALAWSAARDERSLSGQTGWVALAVAGLVIGAVGDAWFLLAGKGTVAGRATVLLWPNGGSQSTGTGVAPVALVIPLPSSLTGEGGEPVAERRRGWARHNWDRLLALVAAAAGAVALLVGWLGLSGVLIDHDQVPWILGGSLLGLWLLGVAATAWLGAVLADQWTALGRIAGRLAELGVSSVAEIPAPALPGVPGRNPGTSGGTVLRGADGIPSLL